jgi:hypothetical protein
MRAFLGCLLLIWFSVTVQAVTITRRSSPVFYTDFAKSLTSMYVGYQITNTGSARPTVWVSISDFSGGSVSLAAHENGVTNLGSDGSG